MDFTPTDVQTSVREIAEQLLGKHCTPERLTVVESNEHAFDRALWSAVVSAGLLEVWLAPQSGGAGQSFLDVLPAFEAIGRHVAPVPLHPVVVAIATIDRFGSEHLKSDLLPAVLAGTSVIVPALEEISARIPARPDVTAHPEGASHLLTGTKVSVPFGDQADHFLVIASTGSDRGVFVVEKEAPGLTVTAAKTTNRSWTAHLELDAAPGTRLGDDSAVDWLCQHATVALCAVQVGVLETALALTAQYTSEREQFGKVLSAFQAVLQRGADAYIAAEALRVTSQFAAWELAEGRNAAKSTSVAKWWASEAGHEVIHTALHLHGGMGNDLDYPLHRYYLWGKQIDASLGAGAAHIEELGELLGSAQP